MRRYHVVAALKLETKHSNNTEGVKYLQAIPTFSLEGEISTVVVRPVLSL